ncbi:MAG: sugar phosphate isomerase/epimerase family protein, partial [Armatimonadota bacterium]|nr:sugar phosphate isomerase/epimerase family protein [Armatimonadota bacterium]
MRNISRITWLLVTPVLIASFCDASAAKQPKVFLCCETYSIRSLMGDGPGKYTPITVMKLMKEMGMKGVALNDIWMTSYDKPYLDQIKKAAKENGIIIAGLICEGNLATDNEEARRRQIEENKMKLQAAGYLGAKIIRFNLGGTGDPARDGTVGVQRVIDAFNQLIPLAKQLNVKLTIENHGGVSKKADWIIQIIKATDPKWVGACLDFKNWPK